MDLVVIMPLSRQTANKEGTTTVFRTWIASTKMIWTSLEGRCDWFIYG